MKKVFSIFHIILFALALLSHAVSAQAPLGIPYQAVARDISGNLLASQNVSLRLSVRNATANGTLVYQETQSVTTNSLGLFAITIGQGTAVTGTLTDINWSNGAKYLQVEFDPAGGVNYTDMGTTQLMSVPYALNAASSNDNKWLQSGNNISNLNSGNVGIGTSSPSQQLHTTGGIRHQSLSGSGPRAVMVDANGNLFTQTQVPGTSVTAQGGNQPIPDFGCASGNGITSTITLSGLPTSFNPALISVTVNIIAGYSNDFVLFLTAPTGQVLRLAQSVGGSGGGFTNTTFTDAASTFIYSGSTPFNGSFKPSGSIGTSCTVTSNVSTFGGLGGGTINPNGAWTLRIFDNIFFETGFFANWSVNVPPYTDLPVSNYVVKWNGTSLSTISSIYDNGNVGIGTNNPTKKLTVAGDILVNGCTMGRGNNSVASNIAIGTNVLPVNSSGSNNIAMGEDAMLLNTSGFNNTGIGAYALENNVAGNSNTGIGYGANVGPGGLVNASAIGARAFVNQSNSLVLGSINGVNGATANTYVGIGTSTPQTSLHVSGPGITTATLARTYFTLGVPITSNTSASGNVVIRSDGWIWASGGGFIATSDKRIKTKLGITNNQKDLEDLSKIEITDYKYIDEIAQGSKRHKKVIAQQLSSVYPLAVDTNKGMIPSVYETAKSSRVEQGKTIIETMKAHDFKTGDEVKIIVENVGEKLVVVDVLNATTFSVNEMINDKVFVYGKKVDDLLIVDYDALTTLNISASQALLKRIESLEKENTDLKKNNSLNTEKLADLEAKLILLLNTNTTANN